MRVSTLEAMDETAPETGLWINVSEHVSPLGAMHETPTPKPDFSLHQFFFPRTTPGKLR
jgi:hypothetical protein